MTEGYDRFEDFHEVEISSMEAGCLFDALPRTAKGPKPGSSAAVAQGLLKLRELTLRRAAKLHRHATGLSLPPMPAA